MARTKTLTGARHPGALPRRVRAQMAARMATPPQEVEEGHVLPSETEEESIFPEDEVRCSHLSHDVLGALNQTH